MQVNIENVINNKLRKIKCLKCEREFSVVRADFITDDAVIKCVYCREGITIKPIKESIEPIKKLDVAVENFKEALKRSKAK